ncbi:uncharacterized protein LOC126603721 [Malus sylvestris]|uniref:uncharacterized protein LOC126603721 n=1 Tax=Malus sylvestris TaxID=3752 RepID=UPI0021AC9D9E|nr:uncharacterized protein LOC126603721 [Malus sylvestris]
MEGLIPLVYKAMKGNRTRRQYICLSSSSASSAAAAAPPPPPPPPVSGQTSHYNIADFYIDRNSYVSVPQPAPSADQHHHLPTIYNVNGTSAPRDQSSTTTNITNHGGRQFQHRRHKSVTLGSASNSMQGFSSSVDADDSINSPPQKQPVQFQGHRRIFSCISGGA